MRPNDRVVVNLAPAELPKQAASFDLPISLGILAASGQFQSDKFNEYAAVGELALEGHMRPIKGALSMAMSARDAGYKGLLVPSTNAGEAAVVGDIEIISVSSLSEAVGFFTGMIDIQPHPSQLQELFAEYSRLRFESSCIEDRLTLASSIDSRNQWSASVSWVTVRSRGAQILVSPIC